MNTFQRVSALFITVASLSAVAFAPAIVSADTTNSTTSTCTVKADGTKNTAGNADSRFVLNKENTATASFTVTGTDCKQDVTIASWQAPDAAKGRPYDQQKLFTSVTGSFAPGKHTITVTLPDCYYQVDLLRGTSPTAKDGGPVYETGVLMGSLHGGTKACTPVTPPTPPTPPVTPPTPPTPPTLPNTGTGSNVLVVSLIAAVAGYVGFYVRQSRKQNS